VKTLLLTAPMPAGFFSRAIRELDPDIGLIEHHAALTDAELAEVGTLLAWHLPAGLAPRLPRLHWVCAVAAGVDKLQPPDLPAPVLISRIVDEEQALGIAQFVVLMALRHARELPVYEAQQQRREWHRRPVAVVRSRVTVLGCGAMGGVVAGLLAEVGFSVRGWNRSSGPLHEALRESDIVVCALPLTPQTRGILDAAAFAQMPRGSYLINVARGAHVVEPDLMAAVRSGHLAGAALDVQGHEPLPADDPLWNVPGITVTPHIAAQPSPRTIAAQFVAGWRRVMNGQPPANVVDRARGY
jgi:glyoxylate/hydroxypyruvate reductase